MEETKRIATMVDWLFAPEWLTIEEACFLSGWSESAMKEIMEEGGVDLNDETALSAAYEKAVEIGEPLSQNLMKYCRRHGVSPFARVDAAHQNLRFLVRPPGRKPLLR